MCSLEKTNPRERTHHHVPGVVTKKMKEESLFTRVTWKKMKSKGCFQLEMRKTIPSVDCSYCEKSPQEGGGFPRFSWTRCWAIMSRVCFLLKKVEPVGN